MPILKKPPTLSSAPATSDTDLYRQVGAEGSVFLLRPTMEIFTTYEKYVDRLLLYSKRVWACRLTGKGHLDFWGAWESEQRAAKSLESFPDPWRPVLLQMIQHCTLPTQRTSVISLDVATQSSEQIATRAIEFAKTHFTAGERVAINLDGTNYDAKVGSATFATDPATGADTSEYRVLICGGDGGECIGEAVFVGCPPLVRQGGTRNPLNKSMIKRFIRSVASRSSFAGSPWVLRDELARQHNLPTELPPPSPREEKDQLRYPVEDLDLPGHSDVPCPEPTRITGTLAELGLVGRAIGLWSFLHTFASVIRLSPFSLDDWLLALPYCGPSPNPIVEASLSALLALLGRDRRSQSKTSFSDLCKAALDSSFASVPPQLDPDIGDEHLKIKWFEPSAKMSWDKQVAGFLAEVASCGFELIPARTELPLASVSDRVSVLTLLVALVSLHKYIRDAVESAVESCVELKKSLRHLEADQTRLFKGISDLEKDVELLRLELEAVPEARRKAVQKELRGQEGLLRKMRAEAHSAARRLDHLARDLRRAQTFRTDSLGVDRHHRRYWWFDTSESSSVKIYVEDVAGNWFVYDTYSQIQQLLDYLNPLGVREAPLKAALLARQHRIPEEDVEEEAAVVVRKRGRRPRLSNQPGLPFFLKYQNSMSSKKP